MGFSRNLLLAIIVVACIASNHARVSTKGAKISLHATWPATPTVHEAAEFLADESPNLFWTFARGWPSAAGKIGNSSDPSLCWQRISAAASEHLTPRMTQVLHMSLALRTYSPSLESFRQLAMDGNVGATAGVNEGCCWAAIDGKAVHNAEDIAEAVRGALVARGRGSLPPHSQLFPFDHVHQSTAWHHAGFNHSDPSIVAAVLYAPIGHPCSASFDAALRLVADTNAQVAYAWRPQLPESCAAAAPCGSLGADAPLDLAGFGVELAIKNMEYNARDDSGAGKLGSDEQHGPNSGGDGLDDGPDVVAGFSFSKLIRRKPGLRQELVTFRDNLLASSSQEQALKVWDLKDLGLQATQRIAAASDPLHLLREVSQNFPMLVEAMSRARVDDSLRAAAASLRRELMPGTHLLLINGLVYDVADINLHDLVGAVRREVRLMDALAAVGLSPDTARSIAFLRGSGDAGPQGAPRLDLRPSEADGEILWLNDLEVDPEYRMLSKNLMALLQPSFTGQPPAVRYNVFNAIYLFNPASRDAAALGTTLNGMLQQGWPIRFGMMPVVDNDVLEGVATTPSAQLSRMVALVTAVHGGRAVLDLLSDIDNRFPEEWSGSEEEFATQAWAAAQKVFKKRWTKWVPQATHADTAAVDAATALKSLASGDGVCADAALPLLRASTAAAVRAGLTSTASTGAVVLNGIVSALDEGSTWRTTTAAAWQDELSSVQQDVYMGRLTDDSDDLYSDLLEAHGALPRYNPRALPANPRGQRYISLTAGPEDDAPARQLPLVGPFIGAEAMNAFPMQYFGSEPQESSAEGTVSFATVTHWVVADAASQSGLQLMADALQHESAAGRVGLVINAWDAKQLLPCEELAVAVASGLVRDASPADLVDLFTGMAQVADPGKVTYADLTKLVPEGIKLSSGSVEAFLKSNSKQILEYALVHSSMVRQGLGLGSKANAVVTNGRVLEARFAGDIATDDFALLEANAIRNQFASPALAMLLQSSELQLSNKAAADAMAVVSSVLTAYQPEDGDGPIFGLLQLLNQHYDSVLTVHSQATPSPPGDTSAPLLIQAVVDPLTKATQKLSGAIEFLRSAIGPDVAVLMHPSKEYADLPLKHFYRYVTPDMSAVAKSPPSPPVALFATLPPHKTLTLGMDVPESWLVQPVHAPYDLDNLRLDELPASERYAEAVFELEALLLTGMCADAASAAARKGGDVHPRGVQLQLGTLREPARVDTLVMSNLGYFQLKAAPGVWALSLAPGRSQELYDIQASSGASDGAANSRALLPAQVPARAGDPVSVPVAMASFSGKHMLLVLRKHADRMDEDVLDAPKPPTMLQKLASKATAPAPSPAADDDDTIHVFTVASGHMYERLQKIMILSAIKRTKASVKFWFIKNYMSPQMKAFVPLMAKQYGFDYEFVTYKWPSWLRKQTEKQRIIWAYKILFLDVLFPLNLKKVIFCDSDQVIRADLKELWNHDLQGAPYAYTPFCDTNTDMEGFRFWKQGFWREHLQGKPYHISALYVVDLERFRQMAAGDQLRVIYDNLSKDPNSLANLDQDLPNYAQEVVPIASLPQEWLWCETWCGEATRTKAKTIDLCNNPLTKEPKLQSARRIIAEWPDLNREAEEFTARVEAVLDGAMTEEELAADKSRFMTFLEPMVEGSVRTSGAGTSSGAVEKGGAATHDATEL